MIGVIISAVLILPIIITKDKGAKAVFGFIALMFIGWCVLRLTFITIILAIIYIIVAIKTELDKPDDDIEPIYDNMNRVAGYCNNTTGDITDLKGNFVSNIYDDGFPRDSSNLTVEEFVEIMNKQIEKEKRI